MTREIRDYLPDYASAVEKLNLESPAEVLSLIRPAFVSNGQDDTAIALGASRLGGEPDLPPDLEWPTWHDRHTCFVAQIDLEELPAMPNRHLLPERGRLYFFYGYNVLDEAGPYGRSPEKEAGAISVFYSEAPQSTLVRCSYPDDLDNYQRFKPERLEFGVRNTIPEFDHPAWSRVMGNADDAETVRGACNEAGEADDAIHFQYQILGYPTPMQASVCRDIEYAFSESDSPRFSDRAEQWELLFQARDLTDDGSVYFMIRREDLLQRRWDRCWFALQGT